MGVFDGVDAMEKLKSELEAARAEAARLQLELSDKDAQIATHLSTIDKLTSAPAGKMTSAKSASAVTPTKPAAAAKQPVSKPVPKITVAKPASVKPISSPTTVIPQKVASKASTPVKVSTAKVATAIAANKIPIAPPKPAASTTATPSNSIGGEKPYADGPKSRTLGDSPMRLASSSSSKAVASAVKPVSKDIAAKTSSHAKPPLGKPGVKPTNSSGPKRA